LTYTEPGIKEVTLERIERSESMRVSQEYSKLLANYKQINSDFKELIFVLEELDKVAEAFELMGKLKGPDDLRKALSLMHTIRFLPGKATKDKNANKVKIT
jgi:5'-deoxynucleotidase YfbR-like HD superfamily hydrolase